MGAGKSTVGRHLAQKLGWKFIDLDEEIERRERRSIAEIFRESGEPHFRKLEKLYLQEVSSARNAIIALGGGAFMDPLNRDLAGRTGLTVWLKVSFANAADRVKIDGTRPKFTDRDQAQKLHESREALYGLAKFHVATDTRTPESIAEEIAGAVRKS